MAIEMTVSELMVKMIEYSRGNLHDIRHFMKVYAFAKTIAECEGISPDQQKTIEAAAILHDIACPLCRKKYGNTNGKYQEMEGTGLTEDFLKDSGLPKEMIRRIVWLVGHHHTIDSVEGIDHQILLEADYLVNADEGEQSPQAIAHFRDQVFQTRSGTRLLNSIYMRSQEK